VGVESRVAERAANDGADGGDVRATGEFRYDPTKARCWSIEDSITEEST